MTMTEHHDTYPAAPADLNGVIEAVAPEPVAEPAASEAPLLLTVSALPSSRHVEAGRKGARRVHRLIEEGRLYEKEHGLRPGRQRLKQLIQEGKLYEQEH